MASMSGPPMKYWDSTTRMRAASTCGLIWAYCAFRSNIGIGVELSMFSSSVQRSRPPGPAHFGLSRATDVGRDSHHVAATFQRALTVLEHRHHHGAGGAVRERALTGANAINKMLRFQGQRFGGIY